MPFNGSGSFSAPSVSGWPAAAGAVISSTAVNTVINDILSGLSAVLPRDGQAAMTGALNMGGQKITNVLFSEEAAAANVASAATVDVGAQAGRSFAVTGTTAITSFGVANNGVWKIVRFAGILTLTHSSNLRLPGSANVTTADGDALFALSLGSGVWEVLVYFKRAIIPGDASTLNSQAASYYTNITARLGYTPANKAGDTLTGALGVIKGSASAPGLFFSGDTNTGVDSSAADTLDLTTAGVRHWQVDSTGRLLDPGRKQPCFHALTSATRTTTGDFSTYTSEVDNTGDFNSSTGVFTAPVAGWYEFSASFLHSFTPSGTAASIQSGIYLSTLSVAPSITQLHAGTTTTSVATVSTGAVYLTAGTLVYTLLSNETGVSGTPSYLCNLFTGRLLH